MLTFDKDSNVCSLPSTYSTVGFMGLFLAFFRKI